MISPLTKSTYSFIEDILIYTIFTCFASFDKTQSSLRTESLRKQLKELDLFSAVEKKRNLGSNLSVSKELSRTC